MGTEIQRKAGHTFLVLQLDGDDQEVVENRWTAARHAVSAYDRRPRFARGLIRLLWDLGGGDGECDPPPYESL